MPTIFLHIGRGKTGTTILQRHLAQFRDELGRVGVLYPKAGEHGGGHQSFAKSLLKYMPSWMERDPEQASVQDALRSELESTKAHTIVMSSENFTLVDPRDVQDFFSGVVGDWHCRIIFFARTQDEVAESQYNQDVKWCREITSFDNYVESGRCEELDYHALLEPWGRHFGQNSIVARIYDAQTLLSDFFDCFGSALSDTTKQNLQRHFPFDRSFANASLGYHALSVLRALNHYEISDRHAAYSDVVASLGSFDVPAVFFSASQARNFRDRFRVSNLLFSEAYLGQRLEDLGGRRYSDEDRDALSRGFSS